MNHSGKAICAALIVLMFYSWIQADAASRKRAEFAASMDEPGLYFIAVEAKGIGPTLEFSETNAETQTTNSKIECDQALAYVKTRTVFLNKIYDLGFRGVGCIADGKACVERIVVPKPHVDKPMVTPPPKPLPQLNSKRDA